MQKRLLFIFNPYSGKGLIKNYLVEIVDTMVKAGYDVTIYTTQCQGDAIRKVAAEAQNYDRIVCSGGDGTLDEVMTGLLQSNADTPIGYIPAGSTNDFANSLMIPKHMVQAAKVAVEDNAFPCDIGYFNGDTFVYVAAFGVFTDVSYQTPQQLKNVLGHVAYILEGAKRLNDLSSYEMRFESNGQIIEDRFILGMVTNSISVGGFKGITGSDVKLDDGEFEVTLIKKPKNLIELNQILASLTNLIDDTDLIYTFRTKEIHFTSKEKIPWTLDGEFGGEHEDLTIRNLKQRVTIYVPNPDEIEAEEDGNLVEFGDELFPKGE